MVHLTGCAGPGVTGTAGCSLQACHTQMCRPGPHAGHSTVEIQGRATHFAGLWRQGRLQTAHLQGLFQAPLQEGPLPGSTGLAGLLSRQRQVKLAGGLWGNRFAGLHILRMQGASLGCLARSFLVMSMDVKGTSIFVLFPSMSPLSHTSTY